MVKIVCEKCKKKTGKFRKGTEYEGICLCERCYEEIVDDDISSFIKGGRK